MSQCMPSLSSLNVNWYLFILSIFTLLFRPVIVQSQSLCGLSLYQCQPSGHCILSKFVCDGIPHCPDGSDETICGVQCDKDSIRCATYDQCVPYGVVCDGKYDCADRSDEQYCLRDCGDDSFRCSSSDQCISSDKICDRPFDCPDLSDEHYCYNEYVGYPKRLCSQEEFMCVLDGLCIPRKWRCDDKPDCYDNSDEENCLNSTEQSLNTSLDGAVYCPAEKDHNNVTWEAAKPGKKTYMENLCPRGYYGDVYRYCDLNGIYQSPVYDCTKQELREIMAMLSSNNSNKELALSHLVNATKSLNHRDILSVTDMLNLITEGIDVSEETVETNINTFLDVADNLMNARTKTLWKSIINETGFGVNTVISSIERFVEKVATRTTPGKTVQHFVKSSIYLAVGSINNCNGGIEFPNRESESIPSWANASADKIFLPCNIDIEDVTYSSCIYKDLRDLIPERSDTMSNRTTEVLNSPVLAMTLYGSKEPHLSQPVTITFHLFEDIVDYDPKCYYWNANSSLWSTDGCDLESYNKDRGLVVCKCSHLTNFAILMSPSSTPPEHIDALSVISMVGCITSMLFLALTFGVYLFIWKKIAGEQSVVLLNLCISLFLAYLVFLVGVDKVSSYYVCTSVAVFLHYIYLTVFFIMLIHGLMLAKSVLKPFNKTPIAKWGIIASHCLSTLTVGITMAVSHLEGYGTNKFCWLSISSGLLWAFIVPAAIVMLINATVIAIVLFHMCSRDANKIKNTNEKVKMGIRSVCVLTPILGVTWILGVFSVNEDTFVFQYLFAIFNSIQGFLIFIFHCCLNATVRTAIQERIKRSKALRDTNLTNLKHMEPSQSFL